MAVKISEVEIYNSTDGICKEIDINSASSVTITTYGVGGTCELEMSIDGGTTYFPRFAVNMRTCNANYRLSDEGMFYTICTDCDKLRISNVVGFDRVVASLC